MGSSARAAEGPAWAALPPRSTSMGEGFWGDRARANRELSLLYQWERYEEAGTVDNFRIAAGLKRGARPQRRAVRRGFFYSDSDLHKWADAASRALRQGPVPALEARLGEYSRLAAEAQESDGYLFTYNQILFPGTRWKNLMIEHELYCLGHFIEAGVSSFECVGKAELLELAEKAAGLVVREFRDAPCERTSGHEEIELALLRLYRATGRRDYLETARALLERRGGIRLFGPKLLLQLASQARRSRVARIAAGAAETAGGEARLGFEVGGNMAAPARPFARRREPPFIALRSVPIFLSGAYQQQDRRIAESLEPRGHAVRWAYLMASCAMLASEPGDADLLRRMAAAWESLVGEKMYATGGIGALPLIEGFGRPYELDNAYSYSETCAAIGSVLWNRELSLASPDARYADLAEWQLYNAVSVGASPCGDAFFYRNPLASDGGFARKAWFATSCCPSNLSRLWADADRLAFASAVGAAPGALRIDQYVSASARLGDGTRVELRSALPWSGSVAISVEASASFALYLRFPGWSDSFRLTRDGREAAALSRRPESSFGPARFAASYERVELPAGPSELELELGMPIAALHAHPRVRPDRGRAAICRGPLVYCAEAADNPGADLDELEADPRALAAEESPDPLVPGQVELAGRELRLVPYFLWGNRGPGAMRVFLRARS